jgi:large subunit ribosomal protein L27
MSKTKGGGSTRNGRDSEAKRLGVKVFDGQTVTAAAHVLTGVEAGAALADDDGAGGDDTLFALAPGKVKFGSRKGRKLVDVLDGTEVAHGSQPEPAAASSGASADS